MKLCGRSPSGKRRVPGFPRAAAGLHRRSGDERAIAEQPLNIEARSDPGGEAQLDARQEGER